MKTNRSLISSLLLGLALTGLSLGCSSNKLRKFKDEDISQGISTDLGKKFEVKDKVVAPTPTPSPPASIAKNKKVKSKKMKEKNKEVISQAPTPIRETPPIRKLDPMPFKVGEKLAYDIRYVGVTAGTFNVEVAPMKVVNNRSVYHFTGLAKTVKLFELIYRVNDQIESFWDEAGLFSLRYTMDLDESKQSRKVIELYDYDQKKSFYWNRIDHVEKGFSEQKEEHDIALWSQDPLSALYYMRSASLPQEVGKEAKFPVIVDGKPWECQVRYTGIEKIYAGGKYFEADVYQLQNFQNGEVKNRDNRVWISRDEHHYVLRIEAKLRVGSFAVALDKIL